jgi:hypothetical protein
MRGGSCSDWMFLPRTTVHRQTFSARNAASSLSRLIAIKNGRALRERLIAINYKPFLAGKQIRIRVSLPSASPFILSLHFPPSSPRRALPPRYRTVFLRGVETRRPGRTRITGTPTTEARHMVGMARIRIDSRIPYTMATSEPSLFAKTARNDGRRHVWHVQTSCRTDVAAVWEVSISRKIVCKRHEMGQACKMWTSACCWSAM